MNRGKRIKFFATRNDMLEFLKHYDCDFKYVECKNHEPNNVLVYKSIEDIPHLGYLNNTSHCMENYLMMRNDTLINTEVIQLKNGSSVESVYQCFNMDSVVFSPSGIHISGTYLIHGQIATISDSEYSIQLFNTLKKSLKKQCVNYSGWYIGKEAMKLYGEYRFITIGIGEPEEYDFRLPNDIG